MSITYFQVATAAFWFVTALVLVPGTYRAFFGTLRVGDPWKTILFFVALVQVSSCLRFLVAPHDVATWIGIYCLSMLCAVCVWVACWNMRRDA